MENNEKNKGGASSGKKSGTPSEKKKGKTASSKSGTSGASVKGASGKESGKSSAVKKGGTSASKSPKTAASRNSGSGNQAPKPPRAFRRHGFSGALNPDCAGCVCVCGGEILYFRVLLHRPAAFRREPDGSRFRGIFVRHPVPLFRKFSVWLFLQ